MDHPRVRVAMVLAVALLAGACGDAGDVSGDGVSGELLVSAAASLTDAFSEIAAAFEETHPAVEVTLNLAGTSALREQILAGAPVDVFAAADPSDMEQVAEAVGVAGDPVVFARNRLTIAVPAGNPGGVDGLEDLARGELLVGLCAEDVPCGDLAREVLRTAGVTASPDTNEPDVRALLTKIEAGELDAGIVYVTDLAGTGGGATPVPIEGGHDVVATYPIAVLASAPNPEAASAFADFVRSPPGRAILAARGFEVP